MLILGIETSCDETSVALLRADKGRFSVLSNIVSSQVKIHAKYGGVVPEVAARKHAENMMPVLKEALTTTKVKKEDVDVIAVTHGPGLAISLLVGVETARTLAFALKKKLVGVNHIEAHILANTLLNKKIKFPAICLVVSGGHTQLVLIKDFGKYKIIGETVDDAVGECFDKVAKIMGLGYPGGPIISKLAEKGNASAYNLPRPMEKSGDFNFSFSGLKTAVLYMVRDMEKVDDKVKRDMSASFEEAATDVLVQKTIVATKKFGAKTVMIAGGVSANKKLRKKMEERLKESLPKTDYLIPEFSYCTDNAAMIAAAGYFKAKAKKFTGWDKLDIEPNLRLK
jgi:N6-L-threonylcarbamoyladenine synthase